MYHLNINTFIDNFNYKFVRNFTKKEWNKSIFVTGKYPILIIYYNLVKHKKYHRHFCDELKIIRRIFLLIRHSVFITGLYTAVATYKLTSIMKALDSLSFMLENLW